MFKFKSIISGDGFACLSVVGMGVAVLFDAAKQGQRPLILNQHCRKAKYLPCKAILSDENVRELESKGYLVLDDVLDPRQLVAANADVKALQSTLSDFQNSTSVARSDILRYLTQEDRDSVESSSTKDDDGKGLLHAQNIIRGLGETLLEHKFSGFEVTSSDTELYEKNLAVPDEVQLSLYRNTGTSCVAHRDGISLSFSEMGILQWLKLACCRVRVVTAILYLNESEPAWSEKVDGGCLRLYIGADRKDNEGTTASIVRDIEPKGGRLVLFNSQDVLHEVMNTRRDRYAITVWFTIGNI